MVAVTRTAAASIAILSALTGAAASTETRDVYDDIAALDARDVLNEGAEPLALDARDFEDELSYETRDIEDDLEKRFLIGKLFRKIGGKVIKGIAGHRHKRSLDDSEDFLETRDIGEDIVTFDTRDLGDDFPLEARAILDGSHPDLVVVNKRFLIGKLFRKIGGKVIKGIAGHHRHKRSLDDSEDFLETRDIGEDIVAFDTRDLGDDVPLEARAILDGSHPDLVVVNKRFLNNLLFRDIDDEDLDVRDFDDEDLEIRDFDDEDLEVRDFDDYEVSFEARDEEESTAEGPSDDTPSPRPKKSSLKKGKLGKKLKGLKGLKKSKFGKKAGFKKGKKFGKKGPKSGKKSGKKARKSKKGTRSVDGGEFYEA